MQRYVRGTGAATLVGASAAAWVCTTSIATSAVSSGDAETRAEFRDLSRCVYQASLRRSTALCAIACMPCARPTFLDRHDFQAFEE